MREVTIETLRAEELMYLGRASTLEEGLALAEEELAREFERRRRLIDEAEESMRQQCLIEAVALLRQEQDPDLDVWYWLRSVKFHQQLAARYRRKAERIEATAESVSALSFALASAEPDVIWCDPPIDDHLVWRHLARDADVEAEVSFAEADCAERLSKGWIRELMSQEDIRNLPPPPVSLDKSWTRCTECGRIFRQKPQGRPRMTHNDACRKQRERRLKALGALVPKPELSCE